MVYKYILRIYSNGFHLRNGGFQKTESRFPYAGQWGHGSRIIQLIRQIAEQAGKKLRPKQAEQLWKQAGKIDREAAETVFRCSEKSKAEKKTVKIWIDTAVYRAYLADVGEADVSEIMDKALRMYFGCGVKRLQGGN